MTILNYLPLHSLQDLEYDGRQAVPILPAFEY